ncbi:Bug family tripartite tricarboxylate transporter substrate binding protein [Ottowia thiooxydans]|uniref:Bug family tripartite tricarboxylate transporter substrate binding protein n=1 Tax=Ottowia thiooxydans TaxID=219182 RepID=UPI00042996C9|nr:tripartite tricarboxylate transporter substrate-binding protein [Ottowia thiooxydans]
MLNRRQFALSSLSVASLGVAAPAWSQSSEAFPSRAITIVIPYVAGGLTDIIGRALAPRLAEKWGKPVLIDNKPGGGTTIGTGFVSRAPGDGYTLLLTAFGYIGNQLMLPKLPYDVKALTPLTNTSDSPSVLYISPRLPVKTLAEFVAYGKANPGKITIASSGNGSSPHIAAEMFAGMAGIEIIHVPYRGNGPAITDLVGGQVDALFDSPATMSYVTAGRLRVLGHGYANPNPRLPGVPPISKSGVPGLSGFEAGGWFGFFLPSSTPEALQQRLYTDIRAVLEQPGTQEALSKAGVDPRLMTRAEFTAYLQHEMDRWGPVIRSRNIRAD